MRLLVVDDEPLIRSGILHDLRSMEGVEVTAECGSVADAVRALKVGSVDLVLLDVQLPDGTGFDVLREVGARAMPAVIFVTAYDQYAIQAFEFNAIDYILKPFDDARLRSSIERVRDRVTPQHAVVQQLESLLSSKTSQWLQRLVVKNEERIDLVPVDTIDWVESANNYTVLHCGEKTHVLSESLSSLEQRLDPAHFLRIHRQRIVNLSRVVELFPILGGSYELELTNGTRLGSGRQFREGIQSIIRG